MLTSSARTNKLSLLSTPPQESLFEGACSAAINVSHLCRKKTAHPTSGETKTYRKYNHNTFLTLHNNAQVESHLKPPECLMNKDILYGALAAMNRVLPPQRKLDPAVAVCTPRPRTTSSDSEV
jgi:hypothetical protein